MGFSLKAFGHLVQELAPVVLPLVPGGAKLAPVVPIVSGAIVTAEHLPGLSGDEKKQAVREIVRAGVEVANRTGKVALDPAEIDQVLHQGIDAVVGAVNAFKGIGEAVVVAPPSVPPALPA